MQSRLSRCPLQCLAYYRHGARDLRILITRSPWLSLSNRFVCSQTPPGHKWDMVRIKRNLDGFECRSSKSGLARSVIPHLAILLFIRRYDGIVSFPSRKKFTGPFNIVRLFDKIVIVSVSVETHTKSPFLCNTTVLPLAHLYSRSGSPVPNYPQSCSFHASCCCSQPSLYLAQHHQTRGSSQSASKTKRSC